MFNRPVRILLTIALGVAAANLSAGFALAQKSGHYRVVQLDGKVIQGTVKEIPGAYEITTKWGIVVTIRKNDVRRMEKIPEPKSPGAASKKGAKGANAGGIDDEIIAAILGDDALEGGDVAASGVQDLGALPMNETSVAEMKRIAGANAKLWVTDHLVLVYTSDKKIARRLASRLERIYSWVHTFMKMFEIPSKRPEYKLEMYFFESNKEYQGYGNNVGGIPAWAAGFYMRTNNRSAFYDMNDGPGMADVKRQLKRSHWRRRQYWTNRLKRRQDFFNVTVIQHEAAHHIHFNVGVFPKRGDIPHWVAEGLAQMFELPPGNLGGSLGATNHFRLGEFLQQYSRKYGGNPRNLVKTRLFISDDNQWTPSKYAHGWALNHFLYKKRREQYGAFMRMMSQREEDVELTATQQQQAFEDLFGPADDKFHTEFLEYISSIQFRRSALDF